MTLIEKIIYVALVAGFVAVCAVAIVEAIRPELPKGPRYE